MKWSDAFQQWFNENKNSDELIYAYCQYKHNMEQIDKKPMSFRQWALDEFQED
jgi:hypothetical protein